MRHNHREWDSDFLASLALTPNVAEACRNAGITRKAAYDRRKADPDFAAAWDEALEESTDELVAEVYRRATHGVEKPIYYKGNIVGHVQEYSDSLAAFLLRSHRRSVYGEQVKQDHTGELVIRVEYGDDPAAEGPPETGGLPAGSETV